VFPAAASGLHARAPLLVFHPALDAPSRGPRLSPRDRSNEGRQDEEADLVSGVLEIRALVARALARHEQVTGRVECSCGDRAKSTEGASVEANDLIEIHTKHYLARDLVDVLSARPTRTYGVNLHRVGRYDYVGANDEWVSHGNTRVADRSEPCRP
jgi:hypothetical protein